MADRYLIENRERGGSRVQMFHMRQRWGAAVWRAQTQVLLPWWAEVCSIPGWEEAESRRACSGHGARRWRPVGGHTPVGLAAVGGLAEISAGVLGTAATWVASAGSRAAGGEAQTPHLVRRGLREAGPWFFWGARCAASPLIVKAPSKTHTHIHTHTHTKHFSLKTGQLF
jgi:hypothetical protein